MTTGAAEYPHGAATSPENDPAAHEARVAELKAAMPQWLEAAAGLKPVPNRNPSLPTLVGLMILILCFFVVLTSLSLKDQARERSVMSGLSQAFSKSGLAPPAPDTEADTRKLLGDLRAELNAEVPLISGVAPETADDYTFNMPRSMVLDADGTTLAPGFSSTLDQTMKALRSGPADFAYEIEVALSAPQMNDKAIAGANAVATALRKAGFANDAASVSLQPGDGAFVALTVRLRPNARVAPAVRP